MPPGQDPARAWPRAAGERRERLAYCAGASLGEVMTHEEVAKAVTAAERSIAAILRDLEQLTGANVQALFVVDDDVTTCDSPRKVLARRVSIELRRQPGTWWMT